MKTAEEIYGERIEAATDKIVSEWFESPPSYMDVVESIQEDDPDFINDVYLSVQGEIDDLYQRWGDRDS